MKKVITKLSDAKMTFNRTLADSIRTRFSDACTERKNTFQHFDIGLEETMLACHRSRREILSEDEKSVAAELAHVGLGLGKRKAVLTADIFADLVRNSIDMPLLSPSPVPDLPENVKQGIVDQIKTELFENQFSGDLRGLAVSLKLQAIGTTVEKAKDAAARAELKIRDGLAESDFRIVTRQLLDDFCSMPYCVSKSPAYKYVDSPIWKGDKLVMERKIKPTIERINPFDFWILNGTTPQNAEAVFEVASVTDTALEAMKTQPGYISEAIDAALSKEAPRSTFQDTTVLFKGSDPESTTTTRHTSTDSRELLWAYCRIQGADLLQLEVSKHAKTIEIDPNKVYETCTGIVNNFVVHIKVLSLNSSLMRPYQVSSFEKIPGSWAGIGMLQRVMKAERIARSFMYSAIRNAAYSAMPSGEIDWTRLKDHYPSKNELNEFNAGHMYVTSPDRTGATGGRNAVNFYSIPNNSQQLLAGMTYFTNLVDELAGGPKVSAGNMEGNATLGRSYRGIALVQMAESKTTRAALDYFDRDIVEPILKWQYFTLLENTDDVTLKGDCNIIARSTTGYLIKEAQASARQETLNAFVGLAQSKIIDVEIVQMLAENVLEDNGVDIKAYKERKNQAALLNGAGATPGTPLEGLSLAQEPDVGLPTSGLKGTAGDPLP